MLAATRSRRHRAHRVIASAGSSLIGDFEQHVGVAGLIERAVAREVAPAQLPLDLLDRDRQPTREQILPVATNCFWPPELQRMWVAPLGGPRHDNHVRREPRAFAP